MPLVVSRLWFVLVIYQQFLIREIILPIYLRVDSPAFGHFRGPAVYWKCVWIWLLIKWQNVFTSTISKTKRLSHQHTYANTGQFCHQSIILHIKKSLPTHDNGDPRDQYDCTAGQDEWTMHYIASHCITSPASRLFTQPFIQTQIKENIKAPRHWPLCGEFTGDRWIPRTKGQLRGKYLHLMTSSWANGTTDVSIGMSEGPRRSSIISSVFNKR